MTSNLVKKLEAVINRALQLDPETLESLSGLTGKVLSLDFMNTRLVLYLFPSAEGLRLDVEHTDQVNVSIRGTPADMVAYLMSTSGNGGGFTGRLEIIGDVALAQRFQSIIKNIDVDWEEHLSHWLGDTLAHKMGNLVRNTARFASKTRRTLELDISEYLRYETEILPDKYEVDEYIAAIDVLRNDAERLKLRVRKLEKTAQQMKAE